MTIVAGIGRAELRRNIRPRNAQAMIVPLIDDHVGPGGHMARRAGKRRFYGPVLVMCDSGVLVGGMAFQADAITRGAKRGAVRIMAIAAGDTRREHLALLERAIFVGLVEHLAVGMINPVSERRDRMRVGEPVAGDPILGKRAATRVATSAS